MGASTECFRWTHTRFLLSSTRVDYSGSAVVPDDRRPWSGRGRPEVFSEENLQGRWMPLVPVLRVASDFTVGLYVGLPLALCTVQTDERGTSPVKLTNHFPEVNPPTTLTLEQRLTVYVATRRSFELTAVLHHFAEAGTSSRPNRESSPGLVSWLLRYHFLG